MSKVRLAFALWALCCTSCSYVWVKNAPPPAAPVPYYACTGTVSAPVVDSVIALSNAAAVPFYSVSTEHGSGYANSALVGTLVGVALFGSSAVYGYYETARCREAQASLVGPYRVPPPPGVAQPPPPFGACHANIDCPAGTMCASGACLPTAP